MYRVSSRFLRVALILAGLAIGLGWPGVLLAQDDLKLRLSTESDDPGVPPTLGEFPISLDSGVLTPERRFSLIADEFQPPAYRIGDDRLVLRGDPMEDPNTPKEGNLRTPHARYLEGFSPTLTWTAPYLQTNLPPTVKPALGARRRIGRWAVYGEFARDAVPQLGARSSQKTNIPLPAPTLANRSVFSGSARNTGTRPLDPPLDPRQAEDSISAIALDNYYLEAIYNFLPSFQGKVSYNRAIAETRDRKEKIQVEGIVEAGKDVVIKAGFRNESIPKLESNRNAIDTKVWTEFILKF